MNLFLLVIVVNLMIVVILMIVVNTMIVVNLLILRKNSDSGDTDDFCDYVKSGDHGEYEKSCYLTG